MEVEGSLSGIRVLVVEDEFLLALSLEEELRRAGAEIVGPYNSLAAALEGAKQQAFDVATLDVNLAGEMVYPLADMLMHEGRPFLFVSGYVGANMPERFRSFTRLPKPYDPDGLIAQLRELALAGKAE
ncbi:MAG TPA: response regulator [Devosia sp.]|jgi:DNA-binding response OmpR family regulator|nr:response regulator [Devosia sp.]